MIQVGDKEIDAIYYGDKEVEAVYLGEEKVWEKKGSSVIPQQPTVIRIDQTNPDPYTRLSGDFGKDGTPQTNVITWIRANSHRYVGEYDTERGMVLRQLDDNDSTKYIDGSDASADITGANGGDVFMKMPDFWFKGVDVDGNNIVDMMFTIIDPQDKTWTKWDGNTLIGVYEGYFTEYRFSNDGELYSRSNISPSGESLSLINLYNKARNRSNGDDHFSLVTYEAHQAMALLYMAYYGNTDSSATCGVGAASYPKVTGATNIDGMNDTVAENTRSINFWGLENWWGDVSEFVDNIHTLSNDNEFMFRIYDYDNIETGKKFSGKGISGGCIKTIVGGEELDVFPTSGNAPSTYQEYFCDALYASSSLTVRNDIRRGGLSNNLYGGVFTILFTPTDFTYSASGTRLQYEGRVVIDDTAPVATTMKKARAKAQVFAPIDLQYVYRDGIPVLRTGMDFNICDVFYPYQIGNLSLYGLNIKYDEIEFSDPNFSCDADGNISFDNDTLPESVDMMYKGQLIGTLRFYEISEEKVIENDIEKIKSESSPSDWTEISQEEADKIIKEQEELNEIEEER